MPVSQATGMFVMQSSNELMVIFSSGHSAEDAPQGCRVTQKISPRVAIVELVGQAGKTALEASDSVAAVLEPGQEPPVELAAALSETEALFVKAYQQRAQLKQRPSEGLAWDAEGFLPPDPPS